MQSQSRGDLPACSGVACRCTVSCCYYPSPEKAESALRPESSHIQSAWVYRKNGKKGPWSWSPSGKQKWSKQFQKMATTQNVSMSTAWYVLWGSLWGTRHTRSRSGSFQQILPCFAAAFANVPPGRAREALAPGQPPPAGTEGSDHSCGSWGTDAGKAGLLSPRLSLRSRFDVSSLSHGDRRVDHSQGESLSTALSPGTWGSRPAQATVANCPSTGSLSCRHRRVQCCSDE